MLNVHTIKHFLRLILQVVFNFHRFLSEGQYTVNLEDVWYVWYAS